MRLETICSILSFHPPGGGGLELAIGHQIIHAVLGDHRPNAKLTKEPASVSIYRWNWRKWVRQPV